MNARHLIPRQTGSSNIPKYGEHVVMVLDLKRAFDNVSHEAILSSLNSLNCGRKIHGLRQGLPHREDCDLAYSPQE